MRDDDIINLNDYLTPSEQGKDEEEVKEEQMDRFLRQLTESEMLGGDANPVKLLKHFLSDVAGSSARSLAAMALHVLTVNILFRRDDGALAFSIAVQRNAIAVVSVVIFVLTLVSRVTSTHFLNNLTRRNFFLF